MRKSKHRTDKPHIPEDPKGTEPQNRATLLMGAAHDGSISVTFGEQDLEAIADFVPPVGRGRPFSPETAAAVLEQLNIRYGVQEKAIREAMIRCNLDRRPLRKVLIARGDQPRDEIIEYYEMLSGLTEPPIPVTAHDRIDHRAASPFIIVKKDQVLAVKQPHQAGQEGKNVHGMPVPFRVLRPEGVSGGKGTRTDENYIYADLDGQLVKSQRILEVQNSLSVRGPVGYATGNIIFPGDVVIEGPVSDGFIIHSGGSVTIKQTFDVTEVIARGDLVVLGGMIGRGRALVKVGGALKARFIENCRLASRKTMTVDTDIINCSIHTMEMIKIGDKGLIVGGDITAVRGVRAGGIGKKTGKPTAIHCGVDFTVQQEKEKCSHQLRLISAKLVILRKLMDTAEAEQRAKMEEPLQRLEAEQRKLGLRIAELLGRLETAPDAAVEVSGEIAPGTLIEICQIALLVEQPLRKVRITLDRCNGRLVVASL